MTRNAISVPPPELPLFRRRLLAWFHRVKRDLAWRRTRDPYHIWLSEIMLQQTRVAAAIPYYKKFLARFPTVHHLARARVDAVLQRWAGLGYYSRARNLHRAAKEIVGRHGGQFPRAIDDALALPGVGSYTAAAVLSIAFDEPLPVLDGNVARVLARLGAVRGNVRQPRTWRRLESAAELLLANGAPGNWNQAMMELGATICAPRTPRCPDCPVSRWCRARSLNMTGELPATRRKSAIIRVTVAAAVLLDPAGRTLLVRHEDDNGALFSHLWQFPAIVAGQKVRNALAKHLESVLGVQRAHLDPLAVARHSVTFHEVQLIPFLARVEQLPKPSGMARALPLKQLGHLPISGATRKIAAAAVNSL